MTLRGCRREQADVKGDVEVGVCDLTETEGTKEQMSDENSRLALDGSYRDVEPTIEFWNKRSW